MTVKTAASRLECSVSTIYALVAAGKIRCHRVGLGRGCIRISEEHLAEYLKAAEPAPPAPAPPAPKPVKLKYLRLP